MNREDRILHLYYNFNVIRRDQTIGLKVKNGIACTVIYLQNFISPASIPKNTIQLNLHNNSIPIIYERVGLMASVKKDLFLLFFFNYYLVIKRII